jgi:hypothetical protein
MRSLHSITFSAYENLGNIISSSLFLALHMLELKEVSLEILQTSPICRNSLLQYK